MIKTNNTVISDKHFDTISNLLDGTDFNGVDYDKSKSLFEYGFVYDGRSNSLISTHTLDIWNDKEAPIRFGVVELTLDRIDDVFNENSEQILSETNTTLIEWDELCDSYKINLIENTCGGLNLSGMKMDVTSEKLIQYLKTKID